MTDKEYQRFCGHQYEQQHNEAAEIQADSARQLTRIADAMENPQAVKFIEIPERVHNGIRTHHVSPRSIAEYNDHYVLIDNAHAIQTTLKASEITALIKGGG